MDQSLLALPFELGLAQPSRRRALLGFEIGEIGLLRAKLVVLQEQVDLPEQIASPHAIPELDFQRFELAGRARADVDLLDRLQHAGGEHGVFYVDLAELRRRIFGRWRVGSPGGEKIDGSKRSAERSEGRSWLRGQNFEPGHRSSNAFIG